MELVPSIPRPKPSVSRAAVAAVARTARNNAPAAHRGARGANDFDLLSNLSQAFDPETQRSRDAERASRSLQNTQLLTLSQQLRDAQQATESIRNQLADVQSRLQDAERARDRAEFRLVMVQMSGTGSAISHRGKYSAPRHHSPKRKHRCEEVYPEGGGKVWWVTDEEDMHSDESRDTNGYRHPPKSRHIS